MKEPTENKRGLQAVSFKVLFFTILLKKNLRYIKYFESENETLIFGPNNLSDIELKQQAYIVTHRDGNKIWEYACDVILNQQSLSYGDQVRKT